MKVDTNKPILSDTYNLAYYFLVYFTNDWMAMLILFLALFMMLEVVLIRRRIPRIGDTSSG